MDSIKQEMGEEVYAAGTSRSSSASVKVETRRKLWQQTSRPWILQKICKNQEEPKTPYKCPDCRHTNIIKPTFVSGTDAIHSKRQTFSWMNMFNENVVEFPPQLQKIQQATLAQELSKQMPP